MATSSPLSSLAPSDSVSQTPSAASAKRKNRPGKKQRENAKSAGASEFSSKASATPAPQPGKFPVVFTTGPGEPSRDVRFAIDGRVVHNLLSEIPSRLSFNSKFCEFQQNASYNDDKFQRDVVRMGLLNLAQQIAAAHVNMGLPLGDFGPLKTTDMFSFRAMVSILGQFGEFKAESIGTRFLLADYDSTLASLVRAADQIHSGGDPEEVFLRLWLPTTRLDNRTRFILSLALSDFFKRSIGVNIGITKLEEIIFSGRATAPAWFTGLMRIVGGDATRFNFLLHRNADADDFVVRFHQQDAPLAELGLSWPGNRDAQDLDFGLNVKQRFGSLCNELLLKKPSLAKFFSLASNTAGWNDACGSISQLSEVVNISGVTVVSTRLALSAPQLSLLACFPAGALVGWYDTYNCVTTTTIDIATRTTEFLLLDWLT